MWDAVVIGLGGVGSFALRELSLRTRNQGRAAATRVLGLEAFERAHAFGSSHGHSRIYRHAYFEHPSYVPLLQFSTSEFQRLQQHSNIKLLEECGTLIVEEEAGGPILEGCHQASRLHGLSVEELSSRQLKQTYPQFLFEDSMVGLLERNAGFVRPERAIRAALSQAESNGATIWEKVRVQSIRENLEQDGGNHSIPHVEIALQLNGEERLVRCRKLIVTAGAWTSALIPSWKPHLRVTRQIQAWLSVRDNVDDDKSSTIYHPSRMPTWFLFSSKLPYPIYGIPTDPDHDDDDVSKRIKIAFHGRDDPLEDPGANPPTVSKEEWQELKDASEYVFKNLGTDLVWADAKPCMYTTTPDENFMVGQPKGYSLTYVVAGLSGHGFKMTPGLGRVIVDMAMDDHGVCNDFDVEFLSPSRFGV